MVVLSGAFLLESKSLLLELESIWFYNSISKGLSDLLPKFGSFEWVRYQILSNMGNVQSFDSSELKDIFRRAKEESSSLVRLGYYMILLKHLKNDHQLFASLRQAVRDDNEPYIRNRLSNYMSREMSSKKQDEIEYWFGL